MPRRTFVLLVLVILAGLWTPSRGTRAQTGCPEGGCKVFLPVIHTDLFATATVGDFYGIGPNGYVYVLVTNITDTPIVNISVVGTVTVDYAGTAVTETFTDTFDQSVQDVVFPGEPRGFVIMIPNGAPGRYHDFDGVATVTSASYAPQVRQLDVVESEVRQLFRCPDVQIFELTFVLENNNPEQVFNITARLPLTPKYITFDSIVLDPGTSVRLRVRYDSLGNINVVEGAECTPEPYIYPPNYIFPSPRGEVTS